MLIYDSASRHPKPWTMSSPPTGWATISTQRNREDKRPLYGAPPTIPSTCPFEGSDMNDATLNWIANFIWGIANDVLRALYVRGKYRDVILPMTVLRRLDAVLAPTKRGEAEGSLLTRSSDGQMLFLVNMLSKTKPGRGLGSRIAEVHNGTSLFTGTIGQARVTSAAGLSRPMSTLLGCSISPTTAPPKP
jgi:hypothetical protein